MTELCYNVFMKRERIIYVISIIGLAALIIMLNFTSPTEVGPLGVLLFFTTVYITCVGLFTLLLQVFLRIAIKRKQLTNKDCLYAAVLAFGPIMLMMARSFGAINLWTIALIIVFLLLAEFLVKKRV